MDLSTFQKLLARSVPREPMISSQTARTSGVALSYSISADKRHGANFLVIARVYS